MSTVDVPYTVKEVRKRNRSATSPMLPEIPATDPDLGLTTEFEWTINAIMTPSDPESAKVHKRASNVMKLAQENEQLKAELRGLTDRLEAAERKRQEMVMVQEQREGEEEMAVRTAEDERIAEEIRDSETNDEESSSGEESDTAEEVSSVEQDRYS